MGKHSTPRVVRLSLPPAEQWTLHHVLLDRIDHEITADQPTNADPPSLDVYHAFEILDQGKTSFTISQLEAMQSVLAEYHHSTSWWELERPRIEQLLLRIAHLINQHRTELPAD